MVELYNLKILTAKRMDYVALHGHLPKSYIKWSVADMEKFLNFIGLPNLYSKFSTFIAIQNNFLSTVVVSTLSLRRILETNSISSQPSPLKNSCSVYVWFIQGLRKALLSISNFWLVEISYKVQTISIRPH